MYVCMYVRACVSAFETFPALSSGCTSRRAPRVYTWRSSNRRLPSKRKKEFFLSHPSKFQGSLVTSRFEKRRSPRCSVDLQLIYERKEIGRSLEEIYTRSSTSQRRALVNGWPRGSNTGAKVAAIASPVGIRDSYSSASDVPTADDFKPGISLPCSFVLLLLPRGPWPLRAPSCNHWAHRIDDILSRAGHSCRGRRSWYNERGKIRREKFHRAYLHPSCFQRKSPAVNRIDQSANVIERTREDSFVTV